MKSVDNNKLVEDFHNWYKFWSIRLTAIGSSFLTMWFLFHVEINMWWATNAESYFPMLDPQIIKWIGLALVIASGFARVYKQPKLDEVKQ